MTIGSLGKYAWIGLIRSIGRRARPYLLRVQDYVLSSAATHHESPMFNALTISVYKDVCWIYAYDIFGFLSFGLLARHAPRTDTLILITFQASSALQAK